MKKLLLSAIMFLGFFIYAQAQCVPLIDSSFAMSPAYDSLPCAEQGVSYTSLLTIGYDSLILQPIGVVTTNSFTIDSIKGLPAGITYSIIASSAETYKCINFAGVTQASTGAYELDIYVTMDMIIGPIGPQVISAEFTEICGQFSQFISPPPDSCYKPILNVILPGNPCPQGVGTASIRVNPFLASGSPCGGGTIILDAGVSGGSGNHNVLWTGSLPVDSANAEVTSVTIPPTGSYTFTVQAIDLVQGDTSTGNITINASGAPFAVDAGNNTSLGCTGSSTALLQASITTGNGAGSSFVWSNGQRGPAMFAVPGTYTVTATDASGCLTATDVVTVFGNVDISLQVTHESCGSGDGAIAATVTGGIGQLNYNWSNGPTTPSISGLSAGTYILSVTDTSNCNVVDSVTVLDSCGMILGFVFEDRDADGVQDPGEPGMPGIEVSTSSGLTGHVSSTGFYEIIVPAYGSYSVTVDIPNRYYCFNSLYLPDRLTVPVSGSHTVTISPSNTVATGIDFGLAEASVTCGMVSGHVFEDINANGMNEPNEPGLSAQMISIDPVGYTFTQANGDYMTDVPYDVQLTISGPPASNSYFCGAVSGFSQTYPTNPTYHSAMVTQASPVSANNNFGFTQGTGYDVGIYNVRPHGIDPCDNFMVWMDWKTSGTIPSDCYLLLEFDSLLSFVSSNPPVDTVGANFIGWYFPAGPISGFECYGMQFHMPCTEQSGQILAFTGRWSCGSADACPDNDELTRTAVVGAPRQGNPDRYNAMFVYHQNDEVKYQIDYADSSFSYLISFMNSTNDTAYNMTIVDTLPEHFQLNTISYPFSNKSFSFKVADDNVLVWQFDNINLPPARDNKIESYGFVQFNMIMKPNLPEGTRFENQAAVTFNYGDLVVTNKVENILGEEEIILPGIRTSSEDVDVRIYPNPTADELNIEVYPKQVELNLALYNIYGQLQFQSKVESADNTVILNVNDLPAGMYLLKLHIGNNKINKKVLIKN